MKARGTAVCAIVLLVLVLPSAAIGTQPALTDVELSAAIEERSEFGLASDWETIDGIVRSGSDVGTETWGIVLTADELESLDLDGRVAFENSASALIAYAESLPTFSGVYFDQKQGGQLVLLFTALSEADADAIQELTPETSKGVVLGEAAFSRAELRAALNRGNEAWTLLLPDVPWVAMATDEPANSLRIDVNATDFSKVAGQSEQLTAALGVTVEIAVGSASAPAVCTSRTNCYSPMKAGIKIQSGAGGCSMGFHVTYGSNRRMVTAGHCSGAPGGGFENWFHGSVYVGVELGNRFQDYGTDIEQVDINFDTQASHMIYGTSRQSHSVGNPVTGELICASLGQTNTYDCGTVNDNFLNYTLVPPGGPTYHLTGWDANGLALQTGDSGSPMFRPDTAGALATALGLVSTVGGSSPLLPLNLSSWGLAIDW